MADATLALPQKVKTALDETRILVLGAQVLLGFQFRGTFQEGFEQLPETERVLNAVALILMCGALALLVAPSLYHRVIAAGEDSGWLHGLISRTAQCALAPFALSLGIDVHIGLARITGFQSGIAAGVMFAALALFWWYGFAWIRRVSVGAKERRMAAARREEIERTPLHSKIEQLLTEARVILPGAQALLGFQLAIIVTQAFEKLPPYVKAVHGGSVGLLALSIVLLMAPAAYHRIVYAGEDAVEFHRTGSVLVTAATVPLALGIAADVFVVMTRIVASLSVAAGVAALVLGTFVTLWYVYPLCRRARLASS